jgi:signal transduction histidine kinase
MPFADAVSRMTHEIRTPLNAVIGFASLMQRELHGALGSDRYREYVGHIADCGSRLLCATEQALLLAAASGGAMPVRSEPVLLKDVVALAIRTMTVSRALAEGSVYATIDADYHVSVDTNATRFAVANLIAAAGRASPGRAVLIQSRVECGMLALDVTAASAQEQPRQRSSSIEGHLAIARRLLDMQHLDLIVGRFSAHTWSARVVFADSAQLQLL